MIFYAHIFCERGVRSKGVIEKKKIEKKKRYDRLQVPFSSGKKTSQVVLCSAGS